MRVIVCGGRDYDDGSTVARVLSALDPSEAVVVVGVDPERPRGADGLVYSWCQTYYVTVEPHPADWKTHGRAAGPIRNQQMLDAGADLVIAFPGGRGTADMVARSRKAEVVVLEVKA
jgi:hypothetical protein